RPPVAGRMGTPIAPIVNWALKNRAIRKAIEVVAGIHQDAPLPVFAGRTFQAWARSHRPPAAEKAVVYFHNCNTNYFDPRLGEMTVAVLEHNGYHVAIPRQECCGLPLQSNGAFDAARAYIRRLARDLYPYAKRGYKIVGGSTSCTLMLKREAREILGVEDEELRVVAEQTYDICEFLLMLHERGELKMDLKPLPLTVPYHAPCQQRGHGIGKPAMDLFAMIPELNVIELNVDCCGIAGTYGLKKEKYYIAMKVGERLFREIGEAAPDLTACDSETCRWQIVHGSGVASVHHVVLL